MGNYKDLKYSFPTSAITSGVFADARLSSSSVTQHVTDFNDDKIVNDLSTLGLRVHTQENLVGSNTNSSSFDVFQDATKITSLTNAVRNSSEYVNTISSSTSTLDLGTDFEVISSYQNGSSGSYATQSYGNNTITMSAAGNGNLNIGNLSGTGLTPQVGDVYTWTQTLQQLGGGGAPNFFAVGASLNEQTTHYHHSASGHNTRAKCNSTGFSNSSSVDDVIVTTITLGTLTGSGITLSSTYNGGSAQTGLYVNGANFNTTTLNATNSLYFFHSAWKDSGNDWRIHTTMTRARETANATGSFEGTTITAGSSTNKMGAVITYQDNAGTNTLNTDIVLKLSADNGSNYSTATLTALPDFATGIKMAKVNDLSVTAGTQLKYKIEFANQASGSKEARIRGVSLQY